MRRRAGCCTGFAKNSSEQMRFLSRGPILGYNEEGTTKFLFLRQEEYFYWSTSFAREICAAEETESAYFRLQARGVSSANRRSMENERLVRREKTEGAFEDDKRR